MSSYLISMYLTLYQIYYYIILTAIPKELAINKNYQKKRMLNKKF